MLNNQTFKIAFFVSLLGCCGMCQRAIAQHAQDTTRIAEPVRIEDKKLESALKGLLTEKLKARSVECDDQPYKRADGSTPQGIEFSVAVDKSQQRIDAIHAKLASAGYRAYRCEMALDDAPQKVCVLHAPDQFDLLRYECTNGVNFNISTDDIVARLKMWDTKFGLTLTAAAHDHVEARIRNAPSSWSAFAQEVYAFCPDVVDQGIGTVDALEEDLRTRMVLFLWWD